MKSYPIRVPRQSYGGRDLRQRAKVVEFNRVAGCVVAHLNADLARRPDPSVTTYESYAVAKEIGEDPTLVGDVIFAIDCGANGVTVVKGDYDQAMDEALTPRTGADDEGVVA